VSAHPLECMDCEWVMPMGTNPEFDQDFLLAHFSQTGHRRFVRRGDDQPVETVEAEDLR
jgi:hypothetical protein